MARLRSGLGIDGSNRITDVLQAFGMSGAPILLSEEMKPVFISRETSF
jgi:hypothetical protein